MEEHFVGMENDIDILVSLVVAREEDHRIISIYGMGGSGKTTLAKKIFNHLDVQHRFDSFAWVTVSQQFIADSLLQEILRQLDGGRNKDDIKNMGYRELVGELCKVQEQKSCLVVLDDIWKTEDWSILKHAFLHSCPDSKVLLTTRIQRVAEIGIAHKLNLLTEEEGWQLLQKKAALTCANDGDAHVKAEQEKFGKEMVRKCGYLPLAISVVGGILRKKRTLEEWEIVNRNMNSFLRSDDGMEENREVMQILTLSFEDLPYQLKPCFLYFASYPEDEEIDVEQLLLIWIAEGMILSQDKREHESWMEVAQRYLSELVNRSLVQVQLNELTSISNHYKSYCLHDLIHDLCLRKCKEEDFLEVVDFRNEMRLISDITRINYSSCRLTFYLGDQENEDDKILQEANELTRFYTVKYFRRIKPFGISKSLRNLRFLKVVSFQGLNFENPRLLQEVIKKLIHLRCLSFIECILREVPSSILMLPYLQTFYLDNTGNLYPDTLDLELPDVLWKSKRLTHLALRLYDRLQGKLRLNLTRLETLICPEAFSVLEVEAFSQLTNLRVFNSSVDDIEALAVIINCIKDKWHHISDVQPRILSPCHLRTRDGFILLHQLFMCHGFSRLDFNFQLTELPKYESGMLVNLVELELGNSSIVEDPMPTLEKLPKLKWLGLHYESFVGEELICSSFGFPHLTYLQLQILPNLKKWRIDEGAMPNLSHVVISACRKLEMIPDGMKFLKALRKLRIHRMLYEFNNRIRQGGADFHKVRHVPQIFIKSPV